MNEIPEVKIEFVEKINRTMKDLPRKKTSGSAGYDLSFFSATCVTLSPGERRLMSTGIKLEIPEGYHGEIVSRSGLTNNHGVMVLNSPGIIDSDYRGEVKVILFNAGQFQYTVHPGDGIAQVLFKKNEQVIFNVQEFLAETERGDGGFGHTGA